MSKARYDEIVAKADARGFMTGHEMVEVLSMMDTRQHDFDVEKGGCTDSCFCKSEEVTE
tara:strand:- start:111 stop:287 length:177 start_codon:yes stop_codon:yes gene_type:complete